MATVNPTREQLDEFVRTTPDDKPIVMLNLLKFRDVADYGPGGLQGLTGRQAYSRYSKAVMPLVFEVGGQPFFMSNVRTNVIAPHDESWDEVVLVHYPARRAFLRMVESDAYQAIMHHRTAALADSRLFETTVVQLPRFLLRAMRGAVRVKSLLFPQIPR
ncbi:MAG TPA: DUF1330 domain-containing protein [Polyangium sp.]|nr:DUF1330 domain-containing protein [Polyangium sp.]